MRFNVKRIAKGLNQMRHSVSAMFAKKQEPKAKSSSKEKTGPRQPKAPTVPKVVTPKPAKEKSLKTRIRTRQKGFKARVKLRNTANPPKGTNSKPLNKQQRAQGALDAMAAWKQKRKVSP